MEEEDAITVNELASAISAATISKSDATSTAAISTKESEKRLETALGLDESTGTDGAVSTTKKVGLNKLNKQGAGVATTNDQGKKGKRVGGKQLAGIGQKKGNKKVDKSSHLGTTDATLKLLLNDAGLDGADDEDGGQKDAEKDAKREQDGTFLEDDNDNRDWESDLDVDGLYTSSSLVFRRES